MEMKVTQFRIKTVLILLTITLNSWLAAAFADQEWIQISSYDQIPSKHVYSVLCDQHGLLWFTSDRGIFTYDGQRFKTINSDQGLSGNEIFSLFETVEGDLWPVSLDGKVSTIKHDRIINWSKDNYLKKFNESAGQTQEIIEVSPQNLVIVNSANILVHNTVTRFTQATPQTEDSFIRKIIFCRDKLVLVTRTQIKVFDGNRHEVIAYGPEELPGFTAATKSHQLNGCIYLSVEGELFSLDLNSEYCALKHCKYDFGIQKIVSLRDRIYLCTTTGIYEIDENLKLNDTLIYNHSITDFCVDSYGNYWASSNGDGIYLKPKPNSIKLIQPTDSLFQPNKLIISAGKKSLYIGSHFGKVDQLKDGHILTVNPPKSIKSSSYNLKNVFSEEKQTLLALGSELLIIGEKNEVKPISAKSILRIGETYLIGTHSGILSSDDLTQLWPQKKPVFIDPDNRNTALIQLDSNTVGVGSVIGISSYTLSDDTVTANYFFPGKTVTDLLVKGDTLLFSTSGQGIGVKLPNHPPFFINNSHGLESNIVDEIDLHGETLFYLSANKVGTLELVYTESSGTKIQLRRYGSLIPHPVISMAVLNDTVYFASEIGLECIAINHLNNYYAKTTQRISSVYYKNIDITDSQNPEVDLSRGNIQFNLEIITPHKTYAELEYRIPGIHEEWIRTTDRLLTFSELPSGQHELHIRIANTGESSITVYRFKVQPQFYETTWFYLILACLFVLSIVLTTRHVSRRSEKKNKLIQDQLSKEKDLAEISQRLAELEMLSLRQQINPHFIFNTLNSIQGYYATGDTDQAEQQIALFSSLVRKILNTTSKNVISIQDEIQICKLYLDLMQMRFDNKFTYEILLHDIEASDYSIVPLVLQPFVENSIVHGFSEISEKGKISVEFHNTGNAIRCTIKDNGHPSASVTLNETKQHNSMGTKVTFERLRYWNQRNGFSHDFYSGKARNEVQGYEVVFEFAKIKLHA